MPRKEAVDLPQGPHLKVGTVPTSVNDAARRLRRWPTAIIDRGSARRWWDFDRDEETDRSQKKKLMRFDFDPAIRERMITPFAMRDRGRDDPRLTIRQQLLLDEQRAADTARRKSAI